jgi:lipid II:glycine glycyltransferase (peptidoglycan interpeptide bridge formation enzyme)
MCGSFWQVEIDCVSASEWTRLIDQFDDANLYQSFAYGSVRWGAENLSHIVLKRAHDVVAIAQLWILQPTKLKLGIAYVRRGPLWVRTGTNADAEIISRIVQAMEEEYVHRRGLVLRLMPNALMESMRGQLMARALERFQAEASLPDDGNKTLVLDLSPRLQDLRSRFDRKWRNQLTAAEKRNLTVTSSTSVEEFRTFECLYSEMRLVKRFESAIDIEEFALMQAQLPEAHRMRVFLCFAESTPLAGLVTSALGDTAIYLLGATIDKGRKAKASYLLQWSLIQWLKEKQIRWYDLGGINPEKNPGVYHFKRGLSGKVEHFTGLFTLSNGVISKIINAGLAFHRALK